MLVSKSYKRRNTSSCYVVWIAHVQWHASNSILATCKKVIIIVSLWLEASDPVTSLSFVFFSLSAVGNNDEFKKSDPHTCWTISAIASYVHLENSRLLRRNSHPWPLQCSAVMKHCYEATQMLTGQFEPAFTFIVMTPAILDFLVYCLAIMLLIGFLDLLKDVTLSDFSPFRGDAKLLICP